MISNAFQPITGVGVAGRSWTLHVADISSATYAANPMLDAPRHAKRRTAAETVASVNRGTT